MTAGTVLHVQKVSGISGSENHLLSLLPGLRARGWDARMAMLHEGEEGAAAFARAADESGVPLEPIRMRANLDPAAIASLARAVRRARPAILHTHLVHADLYGQPVGALLRVPLRVSTKHGFNAFRERRAFALADRAASGLAHAHIAISRGLAAYLAREEGFDEESFSIVHYGIAASPEWAPYEGDEPRLLCLGRLVPVKGHHVLLEAVADARAALPSLTLDVAGSGPLAGDLRRAAEELGIAEAVRFLGHVSPPREAIERAAAVVVPSRGEGFGMVALEAMERGRAVVASAVGGLPEIVDDGVTGLLVPPGDPRALAAALVEIGSDLDRARRLGAAGRARAVERFAAERCVEGTEEVYRSALERRS